MNSPLVHKVDVPFGMDDDSEDVPDLLRALLLAHVVLPQHHAVNVPRPVTTALVSVRPRHSRVIHAAAAVSLSPDAVSGGQHPAGPHQGPPARVVVAAAVFHLQGDLRGRRWRSGREAGAEPENAARALVPATASCGGGRPPRSPPCPYRASRRACRIQKLQKEKRTQAGMNRGFVSVPRGPGHSPYAAWSSRRTNVGVMASVCQYTGLQSRCAASGRRSGSRRPSGRPLSSLCSGCSWEKLPVPQMRPGCPAKTPR